jgi:UDP-3-O-[3-hydroxymyristoyl] glucosamine N-acyltransferase
MAMTVKEIAARLQGVVAGNEDLVIESVAALDQAGGDALSFLSNPRYAPAMRTTQAGAVLVNEAWQGETAATLIRVKSADAAFAQAASWLARPAIEFKPRIHPTAIVSDNVTLGRDVHVGPHCVIEAGSRIGDRTVLVAGCYVGHACVIGSDCRLYPHVSLREYTRVGDRVILHNGAVLGSDGFGYVKEGSRWKKIPQVGIVVVGDDVEIGANTTVDRARFGETRIERGAKLDNLVQVAHNVGVGEDVAIAAQTGISGSSRIGERVQLGGQVGVAGHLHVGHDSVVGAQSGVSKDVPPASYMFGYPAMPALEAKKLHAHMARLPELKKKLAEMEARLKALEDQP